MDKMHQWYDTIYNYTERLVGIRSVSPGSGEIALAQEILDLLHADGMANAYAASGFDALEGDPYERLNVYAFVRGQSARTVILLGHFDTVDTQDYGTAEAWALQPAELASRLNLILPPDERAADHRDWMFGRGAGDMKSGIAVNIALIRHLAREAQAGRLPLSVLMLATPDEENESAGVLQAVRFLDRWRAQHELEYLGVLNSDCTPSLYTNDPHRYIYAGSIGKLLPSFLCIGPSAHAGIPFSGLDANLLAAEIIREISMNDEFCDAVPGQVAAPPVTLHAADLKDHYDVQIPFISHFYVNFMALTTTPEALMERLRKLVEMCMGQLLRRLDETERRWRRASGEQGWEARFHERSGAVLSYAELYSEAARRLGEARVSAELRKEWERWPAELDRRERSLHITHRLWTSSALQGPAVVIYYAPPYYPAVAPKAGALQDAVNATMQAHPEILFDQRPYFPYLSDMSYLCLDDGQDLSALKANMPVWLPEGKVSLPGSYSLPLAEMQRLALPVIDWGPLCRGAHQPDEGVLMSYSFETLPQLLLETILRLG